MSSQVIEIAGRVVDRARASHERFLAAAISTPGVVDQVSHRVTSLAYNVSPDGELDPLGALRARFDVPLLIDNNVNLAAVGELSEGLARGVRTFAYVPVGAGVGMGLVVDGEIVRGVHGGAGEIGYLPSSRDPLRQAPPPARRARARDRRRRDSRRASGAARVRGAVAAVCPRRVRAGAAGRRGRAGCGRQRRPAPGVGDRERHRRDRPSSSCSEAGSGQTLRCWGRCARRPPSLCRWRRGSRRACSATRPRFTAPSQSHYARRGWLFTRAPR